MNEEKEAIAAIGGINLPTREGCNSCICMPSGVEACTKAFTDASKVYNKVGKKYGRKDKQYKMAAKGNPKRLQDEATAMAFPGDLIEPGPWLEFNKIGSHNFQVFTWAQKKLGCHNFFDKRFETGPFDTPYAHGHWRTREHHQ